MYNPNINIDDMSNHLINNLLFDTNGDENNLNIVQSSNCIVNIEYVMQDERVVLEVFKSTVDTNCTYKRSISLKGPPDKLNNSSEIIPIATCPSPLTKTKDNSKKDNQIIQSFIMKDTEDPEKDSNSSYKESYGVSDFKLSNPKPTAPTQNNFCCLDFDGTKNHKHRKLRKSLKKVRSETNVHMSGEKGQANVKKIKDILNPNSFKKKVKLPNDEQFKLILSPKTTETPDKIERTMVKHRKPKKIIVKSHTLEPEIIKMKNVEQQTTLINNNSNTRIKNLDSGDYNINFELKKIYNRKPLLSKIVFPSLDLTKSSFHFENPYRPTIPRRKLNENNVITDNKVDLRNSVKTNEENYVNDIEEIQEKIKNESEEITVKNKTPVLSTKLKNDATNENENYMEYYKKIHDLYDLVSKLLQHHESMSLLVNKDKDPKTKKSINNLTMATFSQNNISSSNTDNSKESVILEDRLSKLKICHNYNDAITIKHQTCEILIKKSKLHEKPTQSSSATVSENQNISETNLFDQLKNQNLKLLPNVRPVSSKEIKVSEDDIFSTFSANTCYSDEENNSIFTYQDNIFAKNTTIPLITNLADALKTRSKTLPTKKEFFNKFKSADFTQSEINKSVFTFSKFDSLSEQSDSKLKDLIKCSKTNPRKKSPEVTLNIDKDKENQSSFQKRKEYYAKIKTKLMKPTSAIPDVNNKEDYDHPIETNKINHDKSPSLTSISIENSINSNETVIYVPKDEQEINKSPNLDKLKELPKENISNQNSKSNKIGFKNNINNSTKDIKTNSAINIKASYTSEGKENIQSLKSKENSSIKEIDNLMKIKENTLLDKPTDANKNEKINLTISFQSSKKSAERYTSSITKKSKLPIYVAKSRSTLDSSFKSKSSSNLKFMAYTNNKFKTNFKYVGHLKCDKFNKSHSSLGSQKLLKKYNTNINKDLIPLYSNVESEMERMTLAKCISNVNNKEDYDDPIETNKINHDKSPSLTSISIKNSINSNVTVIYVPEDEQEINKSANLDKLKGFPKENISNQSSKSNKIGFKNNINNSTKDIKTNSAINIKASYTSEGKENIQSLKSKENSSIKEIDNLMKIKENTLLDKPTDANKNEKINLTISFQSSKKNAERYTSSITKKSKLPIYVAKSRSTLDSSFKSKSSSNLKFMTYTNNKFKTNFKYVGHLKCDKFNKSHSSLGSQKLLKKYNTNINKDLIPLYSNIESEMERMTLAKCKIKNSRVSMIPKLSQVVKSQLKTNMAFTVNKSKSNFYKSQIPVKPVSLSVYCMNKQENQSDTDSEKKPEKKKSVSIATATSIKSNLCQLKTNMAFTVNKSKSNFYKSQIPVKPVSLSVYCMKKQEKESDTDSEKKPEKKKSVSIATATSIKSNLCQKCVKKLCKSPSDNCLTKINNMICCCNRKTSESSDVNFTKMNRRVTVLGQDTNDNDKTKDLDKEKSKQIRKFFNIGKEKTVTVQPVLEELHPPGENITLNVPILNFSQPIIIDRENLTNDFLPMTVIFNDNLFISQHFDNAAQISCEPNDSLKITEINDEDINDGNNIISYDIKELPPPEKLPKKSKISNFSEHVSKFFRRKKFKSASSELK